MGADRPADSDSPAPARWAGTALAGSPRGAQWPLVDSPLGGAVARLTGAVSALPDVPSPFPAVGAGGGLAARVGNLG